MGRLALLLLVVCGCHVALPLQPGGPGDGPAAEAARADGSWTDAVPADGPRTDGVLKQDAPPVVQAEAGPVGDAVPQTEAGPVVDGAPVDLPGSPACAGGSWAHHVYQGSAAGSMVFCRSSGGDQCMAESRCAAGWHLCLPAEYLDRGGDKEPSDSGVIAWLAGCAVAKPKQGNYALNNGTCASCQLQTPVQSLPAYWDCPGGSTTPSNSSLPLLGVTTSQSCHRITADTQAMQGYWLTVKPDNSFALGSACCED